MNIEAKKAMGIALPTLSHKGGVYTPMQEFGSGFLYASGIGPACESKEPALGKSGREVTLEQGQQAARSAIGVNVLPGNIPVEIEAIIELKEGE